MADPYRNILCFPSQPRHLYAAIIQLPCRQWTKPWRRQRAICLFAQSAQAMRQRLEAEDRVGPTCFVLQVFRVKGGQR